MSVDPAQLRELEALLFAAEHPLSTAELARYLPETADLPGLLAQLTADYTARGVNLVRRGDLYLFQTAPDLAHVLRPVHDVARKLGRAALETLAIIAYHEPVTRPEIEAVRGVGVSPGTLDVLLEAGWVRPAGRRESPGRPLQYATTGDFLVHFGLASRRDLPGIADLRAAGLLDRIAPAEPE